MAETTEPEHETPKTVARPHLRRSIGGLGFFSLAFGSMIGVGWITALGGWFAQAGPIGAIVAFLAGGSLMMVIGLCYAEVTPMLPVSGGEVAYAYKAFGTSKAFLIGWFLAFGYLSVSAFEAISIGTVLAYMFPTINAWPLYVVGGSTVYGAHLLLALVFTAFITFINYVGVGVATRVQVVLTLALLVCIVTFVAAGVWGGDAANLEPLFGVAAASGSASQSVSAFTENAATPAGSTWAVLRGILAVFVTAPFWFVGFDTIPQAAEERREDQPLRSLGGYLLLAIAGSTLFYIAVILGAGMSTPWVHIVDAALPTAAAFEAAFESRLMVNVVLTAGVIGLLTSWNGFFLAGSRVLFALGRGHIIDARFGRTHRRYATPSTAVLFAGVVTFIAACLGRGAMLAFVDVGSFCIALAFLGVALSLLRLRRDYPDLERPYRMPGGRGLAGVAAGGSLFILIVMLLPGSPGMLVWPLEWIILGVLSLLGLWFWQAGRRYRDSVAEDERAELILEDYA